MCQQTLRLLARYRIPALLLAEHNRGPRHSFAVVGRAEAEVALTSARRSVSATFLPNAISDS